MSSLYDLSENWQTIFALLQDEDVDAGSVIDSLERIEGELRDKVEHMARIIRMFELDAADCKAEASRLAARARTSENRAIWMKQAILHMMKATGQPQLKTKMFSFSIAPTPEAVHITDIDAAWNAGYIKEKRDESMLDKTAIKEALQRGEQVPGAELVRGECLRMR